MKIEVHFETPEQMRLGSAFLQKMADLREKEVAVFERALGEGADPALPKSPPAQEPEAEAPAPRKRRAAAPVEDKEPPLPPAEEPKSEPALEKPGSTEPKPLSADDCREAMARLCDKHGLPTATKVLGTFGVKSISKLDPKDYVSFIQTCDTWKE